MAAFLVDASLPRATSALVVSYGHTATDVRDADKTLSRSCPAV